MLVVIIIVVILVKVRMWISPKLSYKSLQVTQIKFNLNSQPCLESVPELEKVDF